MLIYQLKKNQEQIFLVIISKYFLKTKAIFLKILHVITLLSLVHYADCILTEEQEIPRTSVRDVALHSLLVRIKPRISVKCHVLLYCHYCQVDSDPEW